MIKNIDKIPKEDYQHFVNVLKFDTTIVNNEYNTITFKQPIPMDNSGRFLELQFKRQNLSNKYVIYLFDEPIN